jgi:FMN phosphatase YigB (HAD superfamily)
MAQIGVDADSLWFFDDSRPNVEAAGRLGIRSFLVDGLPAVQRALEGEGLIAGRHV